MSKALARIHIEGFRSLRNVDLELGRVTALIGANGVGKSNLLNFFRMVPLIWTRSLRRFVGQSGGASALLHYGPKTSREMAFRLEFEQLSVACFYSVRFGFTADDNFRFLEEEVGRRDGNGALKVASLGAGHQESSLEELARNPDRLAEQSVRWWLARMGFFHFHDTSLTSALRTSSRVEENGGLRSDGSNLATFLADLRWSPTEAKRKAWQRIHLLVRKVAPFIKELHPVSVGTSGGFAEATAPTAGQSVRLDWIDDQDQVFGPHQLSDGTLRAIALIAALAQPSESLPAFISIDEPELGLHPAAIGVLVGLIRSVSHRCQILLATQSSALLDHFDPEEVVVAERVDGCTEFRRLDSEKLAAWLDDYTLSEIYDKNVIGGRP